MAASCQVVRFQKSTGANGTTQDVNLSFTPKAIIVFSANGTTDTATEAFYQQCIGFSDGTNYAGYVIGSRDAVAPTQTGRIHFSGSVWAKLSTTIPTSVLAAASCTFSTNKVTFTWNPNDAVATDITLIAYGGADITAAKVNTVSIGRNTAGTQDYTGLGFNPSDGKSALFMISTGSQTIGATETTAIGTFACATKTLATDSVNQWYICNTSEQNVNPSDTWRVMGNDRIFAVLNTTGAFSHYSYLTAWITDGFRLNWDGAPTATDFDFSYLVINGGSWDSGTLTAPTTATNNVDYTVSVSSQQIRGLMLAGIGTTTSASIGTVSLYSLGATDGTNSSVIGSIDEDGQNPGDSYRYSDATGIVHLLGTDGATTDRATFDSFSGTNNFRLDWGTKNATAAKYQWVVLADSVPTLTQVVKTTTHKFNITAGAQSFPRTINESPTITVSESLTRVQIKLKPISEPSVSVSETLTRIQTLIKTISESAISVNQTLVRIPKYVKAISESAISVSEARTRLPLYIRPISNESTITVNDVIARFISIKYTLIEPSISINASVQGVLFYLRQISNEPAINTNDVIVRLLAATRLISDTPTISVNQTLVRTQYLLKQISESSINVNDTVQAGLIYILSIVESRVKWYYSLLTRKING